MKATIVVFKSLITSKIHLSKYSENPIVFSSTHGITHHVVNTATLLMFSVAVPEADKIKFRNASVGFVSSFSQN